MRSLILFVVLLVSRREKLFTCKDSSFILVWLLVALLMDIAELLK